MGSALEPPHGYSHSDQALCPGPALVLRSLGAALETLREGGGPQVFDLHQLGLNAEQRVELRARLGFGDVSAQIDSVLGLVSISETELRGVWWLSISDPAGELIRDRIEVCYYPEVLRCGKDDLAGSIERLRSL